MKNIFKIFTIALIINSAFLFNARAQVGINSDSSTPDASAMLDVKSTNKGILIPRMTTTQRNAISSPATGLMVFDNDVNSFYYYDGSSWTALAAAANIFEYDNITKVVKPNGSNGDIANDDFVFGSLQLGDVGNSDHDQRFFFDKSKGAFRAGDVKDDKWDDPNVGDFSVAFGKDTKASGKAALAIGRNSEALGDYSFAIGDAAFANHNFSVAIGNMAVSDDIGTLAIGDNATANGSYSIALGFQANTGSTGSMALGYNTDANGLGALALGYQATANSDGAMAFGYDVTSNETGAVALGYESTANEFASLAFGYNTTANGYGSVAAGYDNTSASAYEATMGLFTTNYTPISSSDYDATDRLFTIGNGTDDANRSDAFSILKNGNTWINGALTIDSTYTFPTMDGISGQSLVTDGNGHLSWSSIGSQNISLNGTDLTISDGNTLDIASINTDTQILSISGADLTISGGNTLDISSANTNIFSNDGIVSGDRVVSLNNSKLQFTTSGFRNAITIKRASNSDAGIAFQNSGNKYPAAIVVPQTTGGNDNGLDFYTNGTDETPNNIGVTMRLTNIGTVTLPEYGQGTNTGTLAKLLAITSNGNVIETNVSDINQDLSISGNTLSLSGDMTNIDLSAYNQELSLNGSDLIISGGDTLDISSINTDTQALSLNSNILSLTNGGTVDLSNYLNTDAQVISLSSNTLDLTNGGFVDLSDYLDNTDAQTLSLSSNTLSLIDGGSVDLSDYANSMTDADNDTKIQVEESPDEDVIRFDIDGVQEFSMSKNTSGIPRLSIGDDNTFIGGNTGATITTGTQNTFLGSNIGLNVHTSSNNTLIGYETGRFSSGSNNTFLGSGAGRENFNGSNNVFLGYNAGYSETNSNRLYIDNSNTSSPLIYGEFDNDLVRVNGEFAVTGKITTNQNWISGDGDDEGILIKANGDVGIGTNNADARLHIKNDFAGAGNYTTVIENTNGGEYANGLEIKAGQNTQTVNNRFISFVRPNGQEIGAVRQTSSSGVDFKTTSDQRLKTNIHTSAYGLDDLLKINVVDYYYKADTNNLQTGFIAQQLYEHFPVVVSKGSKDVKTDPWMVDYGKMTPLLVKAVQEQQQQIDTLKAENQKLQAQTNKINQLETMLLELQANFDRTDDNVVIDNVQITAVKY